MIGERLLAEEDDDPVLSLVNLIDVFLVIIAALLLAMAQHPLSPFSNDKLTVIRNAGQANMEVVIKNGQKVERYKADASAGVGSRGVKAGVAYRMADGAMVYVPE
ncbi:DUF2149 domain-containing protein [Ideonella oryzae]|uniref:DUF2149 domain-containing protein n=1 Tax=Ideonella oryzae TaxID=2937441 RepID=A0ABT1BT82_9BURK|nr:DUF2149 domain-containing protein [Ideonella oryzae]MCO5979049.1 DUF2149 domain-containing protein [Ideonella oryzae]